MTQTDMTKTFSRVAADLALLKASEFVLDGELVALDEDGRPSFQGLQEWHRGIGAGRRWALAYYVFDLLELNGKSWMERPLVERQQQVSTMLVGESLLRSEALPGGPVDIERQIRLFGLEGIVAKRRSSPYRPGCRSRDWLKLRFSPRQEFVVGGYRPSNTSFTSLLVGYYLGGELRYAGQVNAGFTKRSRDSMMQRLGEKSFACPFADLPHCIPYRVRHPWDHRLTAADVAEIRWIRPDYCIEASLVGLGRHGLLRDAKFLGLRDDKAPHGVHLERF